MMKKIVLSLLVFFNFSLAIANDVCPMNFSDANLCAELMWNDGPYLGKVSGFTVKFWGAQDSNQINTSPEYSIKIYSWMVMDNGHSHAGPALTWNEITPGVFISKDARFFMGRMKGYWEVKVDLSQGGVIVSSQAQRVNFE
ncbi:MAG: hypothetical protein HON90_17215 [Halobacteriovoraceae bacterium]|jgi:hypothetical protein|nr:hypothetical protein [Halobacteriovoraceae bacterium]